MDIQLIKVSVAAFVLLMAKIWSPLLSLDWHWYALIAVLAGMRPVVKAFGK